MCVFITTFGRETLSFTTLDNVAPTLDSSSPADNATLVALDSSIVLNFSEVVDVESGNIVIYKASDDSVGETIDVTSNQQCDQVQLKLQLILRMTSHLLQNIMSRLMPQHLMI